MDGHAGELSSAEEQVKRLTVDVARVTEELRREQDRSSQLEKQRVSVEAQNRDLQSRLEEVEAAAIKGNKKFAQRLEQRIAELEVQLDAELRRYEEAQKTIKKLDRRVKEVLTQVDEEQKTKAGLLENVDALQQKVKTFKRQVEEAVGLCQKTSYVAYELLYSRTIINAINHKWNLLNSLCYTMWDYHTLQQSTILLCHSYILDLLRCDSVTGILSQCESIALL